jgi:hypothetical protein
LATLTVCGPSRGALRGSRYTNSIYELETVSATPKSPFANEGSYLWAGLAIADVDNGYQSFVADLA